MAQALLEIAISTTEFIKPVALSMPFATSGEVVAQPADASAKVKVLRPPALPHHPAKDAGGALPGPKPLPMPPQSARVMLRGQQEPEPVQAPAPCNVNRFPQPDVESASNAPSLPTGEYLFMGYLAGVSGISLQGSLQDQAAALASHWQEKDKEHAEVRQHLSLESEQLVESEKEIHLLKDEMQELQAVHNAEVQSLKDMHGSLAETVAELTEANNQWGQWHEEQRVSHWNAVWSATNLLDMTPGSDGHNIPPEEVGIAHPSTPGMAPQA